MPTRISALILFASLATLGISSSHAQQCANICLSALKEAAYDETKVFDKSKSEQHYRNSFCDAVHKKQQNNSSVSGDLLTDYFYGSMTSDQSSLAEYDHTYCQSTSLDSSYSLDYSFWSKVVKSDALDKFNSCMKICRPPNGLHVDQESLDTCHFVAKASYTPGSSSNQQYARMNHDANLVNASCENIPYKGLKIQQQEMTFKCTRFGRDGSFVVMDTDQGGAVITVPPLPLPAKPVEPPPPPKWDTVDPDTNKPYTATFQVHKVAIPTLPGAVCAGGTCYQTLSVPAGGLISDAKNVSWDCVSGFNEDHHAFCGWSVNRQHKYDADVVVNGGSFTWYRVYETAQDMVETYTVTYAMPHRPTAAELQFKKDMAEYNRQASSDPCPWTSKVQ